jgi:hypothetical protein
VQAAGDVPAEGVLDHDGPDPGDPLGSHGTDLVVAGHQAHRHPVRSSHRGVELGLGHRLAVHADVVEEAA